MIVRLELPPGGAVSEAILSERLGIGRTPIREALQRLARERLVQILPRRGVIVSGTLLDYLLRPFYDTVRQGVQGALRGPAGPPDPIARRRAPRTPRERAAHRGGVGTAPGRPRRRRGRCGRASSPRGLVVPAAALREVTVDERAEGRGDEARPYRRVKIKLPDKTRALELLGKHLAMFTEKVQASVSVTDDVAAILERRRARTGRTDWDDPVPGSQR